MKLHITKLSGLTFMVFLVLIASCKKEDKIGAPSTAPVITSIWPESGQGKEVVVIYGRNFSPDRTGNVVRFNGVEATVLEASRGKLQVVSPLNAETGKITLTIGGQQVEGPVFTYVAPPEEYIVTTFAGSGTAGNVDGKGLEASFRTPQGITLDAQGNFYVVDRGNHILRKITADGTVSFLAGSGATAFADGTGSAAQFNFPWKPAMDREGNIILADRDNHRIRKITPAGEVTTIAGTGVRGFADGPAGEAMFNQPLDVAVDAAGNIYVADNINHSIRKITPDGTVSTLAGTGAAGNKDGSGATAQFRNPSGLDVDADGNVWVADRLNHKIRKITPNGEVSTVAGTGSTGFTDGPAGGARFADPYGIAVTTDGVLIVADLNNQKIRKITADGTVSTIAGTVSGFADGAGVAAQFKSPTDVTVDASGAIYVADQGNNRIRKITRR